MAFLHSNMQIHLINSYLSALQISIVAASYFCKQLRLFTDAVLTTQLLDDVFKLFKVSETFFKVSQSL